MRTLISRKAAVFSLVILAALAPSVALATDGYYTVNFGDGSCGIVHCGDNGCSVIDRYPCEDRLQPE